MVLGLIYKKIMALTVQKYRTKKTIAIAMALVSDKNEWVYSSEVSACKKAIKPPASK